MRRRLRAAATGIAFTVVWLPLFAAAGAIGGGAVGVALAVFEGAGAAGRSMEQARTVRRRGAPLYMR